MESPLHQAPLYSRFNGLIPFLLLSGLLIPYTLLFYTFSGPPFEDAAMLMRYAQNLADGQGIVWNPGELPVDGATDFLFMVVLAGCYKLGLGLQTGVFLLVGLSHLACGWLVYRSSLSYLREGKSNPQLSPIDLVVPLGLAAFILMGPGLVYLESGFGTPFFAFWALLAWRFALKIARGDDRRGTALGFALAGLACGLARPEGVFLAGLMLTALVLYRGWRESKQVILVFLGIFGILGGAYFLWHWWYFGHALPNPFYIKGGGTLHLHSLKRSLVHLVLLTGPLGLGLVYLLLRQRDWKKGLLIGLPLLGFIGIWILMSNAMNYYMRFQYVVLPLTGLSLAFLWGKEEKQKGLSGSLAFQVLFALGLLGYQHLQYGSGERFHRDGRYDLALSLQADAGKGYTIAVSEAGILPLYSGWKAIDTWGLNDSWIAQNGGITEAYLDQSQPEIIMYRDHWVPGAAKRVAEPAWGAMCEVLSGYAKDRGYRLAAVYGLSDQSGHWYWVKPNFPDSDALLEKIQGMPYWWYEADSLARNFSLQPFQLSP